MKQVSLKNNDIQALRAIAIILVIAQHYWRMPSPEFYLSTFQYTNYWTGVDVFLAISGFLMFRILDKEINESGRTFTGYLSFIIRRFFRLYPALIFWALMSIITAYYIQPEFSASVASTTKNAIPSFFAYSNFYWWQCNYDNLACGSSELSGIMWSLSLEWQLYIALSVIMFVFKSKKSIFTSLILLFLLSLFTSTDPINAKSLAWWIRPYSFILGVFIGSFYDKLMFKKNIRIIILTLGLFSIVFITKLVPYIYLAPLVGILGAICLIPCLNGDLFGNGRLSSALEWIGNRSYSIYLSHFIVMLPLSVFIRRNELDYIWNNHSILLFIYLTLLLTASHLSFKYIEEPFLKVGKRVVGKIKGKGFAEKKNIMTP